MSGEIADMLPLNPPPEFSAQFVGPGLDDREVGDPDNGARARSRATETSAASRSNWLCFSWSVSVVPSTKRARPSGESIHQNAAAPQTTINDPGSPIDVFEHAPERAEADVHPRDRVTLPRQSG
jgi:hypothetical protein